MSDIRVGSVVMLRIGECQLASRWCDQPYLVDSVKGVVMAVTMQDDYDGRSSLVEVQVCWADGRVVVYTNEEGNRFTIEDLWDVTPHRYVNVYLHDRSYGGPEEGGWWYDTFSPEQSYVFDTEQEAEEFYSTKREEYEKENEGRPSIYHTNSEGRYSVWLEKWPAQYHPERRPHYC